MILPASNGWAVSITEFRDGHWEFYFIDPNGEKWGIYNDPICDGSWIQKDGSSFYVKARPRKPKRQRKMFEKIVRRWLPTAQQKYNKAIVVKEWKEEV